MQYLLLIHHDERAWDELGETEQQKIYGEYRQLMAEMQTAGQFVSGSQVQSSAAATTVRQRDGTRLVTDGPFAETSEQLGGYLLVEVENLDTAIALAVRVPSARMGAVEVWPLRRGA
jgi:hypothetical protein